MHIIDRWTYYALEFLEKMSGSSKATLSEFVRAFSFLKNSFLRGGNMFASQFAYFKTMPVKSTPVIRTDLFRRDLNKVRFQQKKS